MLVILTLACALNHGKTNPPASHQLCDGSRDGDSAKELRRLAASIDDRLSTQAFFSPDVDLFDFLGLQHTGVGLRKSDDPQIRKSTVDQSLSKMGAGRPSV